MIIMVSGLAIAFAGAWFGLSCSEKQDFESDLTMANVEALSEGDATLDCSYVRKTESCVVYVGAKGHVKLFNGTILTADANGKISIDGVVVCSSGGTTACKPVECVDLYTKF